MTALDKFIDHINTNAGDYKEFVKLLMESNIQTKDTYKQLLDILPDEEYKKILAKFLVLNKRKIESVTKKVVLLNELNDIYNNLDKSLYTSKIIKKIDILDIKN
jgi:rubrerythrin